MAIRIVNPPSATNIENAVYKWMDLLAEGKYEEAYDFTTHDPYYQWTPALMESVINGYGLPLEEGATEIFKVTKRETAEADGSKIYKDIEYFDTPYQHETPGFMVIGYTWFDLPLNNKWSDLTAVMNILQSEEYITLELNEIHVM